MRGTLTFIALLLLGMPAHSDGLHVACATNFRATLDVLGQQFTEHTGQQLIISSASSGVLYQQIVYGAPFEVLLSADADIPQRLTQRALAETDSLFTYAEGRLVLAYREDLDQLAAAGPVALLGNAALSLAIANPKHAPYGRAAEQVLQKHPRAADATLLRGANVGQTFQMWYSGGADLALVAASYRPAQYLEVPASWYEPLQQQAVVLSTRRNPALARRFMAFLQSDDSRQLIQSHGYRLPRLATTGADQND